jgi:hypothetical protein
VYLAQGTSLKGSYVSDTVTLVTNRENSDTPANFLNILLLSKPSTIEVRLKLFEIIKTGSKNIFVLHPFHVESTQKVRFAYF